MAKKEKRLNRIFLAIEDSLYDDIQQISTVEDRSMPAAARVLIREALQARKHKMQPA